MVPEGDSLGDVGIDEVCSVEEDGCFVGPGARDISRGVSTTSNDKEWKIEGFHVGNASAVCADIEVEAAKSIAAEAVSTTLQGYGTGFVRLYAGTDNILEELDVGFVVDAVMQGYIESMVGSWVERM